MAGGLFPRITVWIRKQTIKFSELNGEINNIINNLFPLKFDDHSDNVAQMREIQDPGEPGSEILPTNLAEELKTLRFQVNQIIGSALGDWMESPVANLKDLNGLVAQAGLFAPNRINSGRVDANNQPMFLQAEGSSPRINLLATVTPLNVTIQGSEVEQSADLFLTGLSLAPSTNNTALVDDTTFTGQDSTRTASEKQSVLPIKTIGSEISSRDGQIHAFKINNGSTDEFFIARINGSNLELGFRGWFFDDSDVHVPRVGINDGDTITLLRLTWVFFTNNASTPAIDITFNAPVVDAVAPASPAAGDWFFNTDTNKWFRFSGSGFVEQQAVFLGYCAQDAANTIVSRSSDFTKAFSRLSTMCFQQKSVSVIETDSQNNRVSVYGESFLYGSQEIVEFTIPTDLDGSETESADKDYYGYITDKGDQVLTEIEPHQRQDLLGNYHPAKPWRAVAKVRNGSGSDFLGGVENLSQIIKPTARQVSQSTGNFFTNSAIYVDVLNANVTIVTNGGPVMLFVQHDALVLTSQFGIGISNSPVANLAGGNYKWVRDGSDIASISLTSQGAASADAPAIRPSSNLLYVDGLVTPLPAGKYLYKLQVQRGAGNSTVIVSFARVIAAQLPI